MALPVLALLSGAGKLISEFMGSLDGDAKRRAELLLEELRAVQAADGGQMRINEAEAAHPSIFVAGWRPFIGWVCGAGFVYEFIVRPLITWATGLWMPDCALPPSLGDALAELVLGMLGMGGMRTLEKLKGVART